MKARYENFITHLIKNVRNMKHNVFYHVVDDIKTKEKLVKMARETRPFMATEIWDLLEDYMDFMKNLSHIEGRNYKVVYENLSKEDFVKRLLFKRPIVFYRKDDLFLMRYHGQEMKINTNCAYKVAKILDPLPDLVPYLREYISYDENLLSSLIGMSSPTYYFNIGAGRSGSKAKQPHIDEGILCGIVGARNSKKSYMEHRFVFPRNDNSHINCHLSDSFWIKKVYKDAFPQGIIPTINAIYENKELYKSIYIDGINEVYLEKRLMLSVIPFIREAISRGIENNRNVFCSVPPIGAGK